ncbi:MAG: dienelactone hydrolase family protein [Phormidesmis sp.]
MSEIISEFQAMFTETEKSFGDISHPVWSGGHGPPIILMHEIDGFAPAFMQLAMRLGKAFTVHAPIFYGKVGERVNEVSAYFCIRREFEFFRLGKTSPIASWVRELAADIHGQAEGSKGVGVVGMCMTGGIVLATISHASVAVGVAAQPSLPLGSIGSRRRKEDLGMPPEDIQAAAQSGTPVLTLRYEHDPICPEPRISSITRQIPSAQAPPDFLCNRTSHPTLTDFFRKKEGTEIRNVSDQAIHYTLSFLSKHLC